MRLTTIVPVYNVERYLRRGLDSLLQQSMQEGEHEILLIDDGSTDGSGKICDEYASMYSSLIRVVHTDNSGVSSARNIGLTAAKGDYVHFMDADDYLETGAYRIIIDLLLSVGESVECCRFGYKEIYANESDDRHTSIQIFNEQNFCKIVSGKDLVQSGWMRPFAWCLIIKTSFLRNNNLRFKERMIVGEDPLFSYQCMACNPNVVLTSAVVYNYYMRGGSASTTFSHNRLRGWVDGMVSLISGYKKIGEEHPDLRTNMSMRIDNQLEWMMTRLLRFKINFADSKYICKEFERIGVLPTSGRSRIMRAADFSSSLVADIFIALSAGILCVYISRIKK